MVFAKFINILRSRIISAVLILYTLVLRSIDVNQITAIMISQVNLLPITDFKKD